ncbi:HAMP domain-containing protein [candidate division WOR-3 bacterium]|nr:HAMP domain-containing protein [candidate division WOR-3 bacterium]
MSLKMRVLTITMSAIILIGVGTMVFVWLSFKNLLKTDIERVGVPITRVFSKQAGQLIIAEDMISLNGLVNDTKQLSDDIIYAIIIDRVGNPIAHTFLSDVPSKLLSIPSFTGGKNYNAQFLNIHGINIQDVSFPIRDGTLGYARIGYTGKYLTVYFRGLLLRMFIIVAIILIVGIIASIFTARSITSPIKHLIDITNRISMGEVDVTVDISSKDEIGQLAKSIRRMAASIKIAIKRLT